MSLYEQQAAAKLHAASFIDFAIMTPSVGSTRILQPLLGALGHLSRRMQR